MSTAVFREEKLKKRHLRIRKKIFGIADHPRLSVHRSHLNLTVKVVNDESERTLYEDNLDKQARDVQRGEDYAVWCIPTIRHEKTCNQDCFPR